MHPYDVLKKPLLSEKSNKVRDAENQYTFEVEPAASKKDVKRAVEKMYEVKVTKVQTAITRGKFRRRGTQFSKKPGRSKKAVVSLAEGGKIPIFEDM